MDPVRNLGLISMTFVHSLCVIMNILLWLEWNQNLLLITVDNFTFLIHQDHKKLISLLLKLCFCSRTLLVHSEKLILRIGQLRLTDSFFSVSRLEEPTADAFCLQSFHNGAAQFNSIT